MILRDLSTSTDLTLPNDLLWVDEFNWSPVKKTSSRGLTGSLIVQQGLASNGRPITLAPPADDQAWVDRTTVQTLRDWAASTTKTFTLTFNYATDTRVFNVMFRPDVEDPVSARPVSGFDNHLASRDWLVTLKLIET